VIANPLFGTTTAEMAALFTIWGDEKGKQFLAGLKDNKVKLSTVNGESPISSRRVNSSSRLCTVMTLLTESATVGHSALFARGTAPC
jgi:hypothetical protein